MPPTETPPSAIIRVPHNYAPRTYQLAAWGALENGAKRAVIVWHRRAGKDLMLLNRTIVAAQERVGVYWHVFPTAKQGRKIIWDGVTKDGRPFLDYWPRALIAERNATEMKLKCRNGSVWQVVGSDNYNDALIGGKTVIILRDAATTQDLDLIANGVFAAENVEIALDKIAGYVQALEEQAGRALLLPVGTGLANLALPEPRAAIANNLLAINATGDGLTAVATSTLSAGQIVSAFVQTLLDDIDVATARQTVGLRALRQTGITYDPASLGPGIETESANIAVTNAALGDSVMVFPPYDLQGIACWGYVKIAGNVRIRLRNGTAGTIDLANSAAWEVWVWKAGQA